MKNSILSQILQQDARARCESGFISLTTLVTPMHMLCSEQYCIGEAREGQDGGEHVDTDGQNRPN